MADSLFNRVVDVTIDTLKLSGFRVSAHIEKTLKPEPNTCDLKIWNLNEAHRSQLEELKPAKSATRGIACRIEAGYASGTSLLWLGDLRTANSIKDGADWITEASSGDGEKAYQNSRISVALGPKTTVDTALRAMVRALGVGEGNVSKVASQLRVSGFGKLLSQGVVISGSTARQLTDWARSADLEWSIQDGAIQFVDRGKTISSTAIRISEETGMVGSPTVDSEGICTVKTLLIPDMRPGALIVLDAGRVKGNYRAEKVTYDIDNFDQPYYCEIEAKRW